jgi:hypothetical protein
MVVTRIHFSQIVKSITGVVQAHNAGEVLFADDETQKRQTMVDASQGG